MRDESARNQHSVFLFVQVAGMLGMQEMNADEMTRKLEDMLPVIRQVNEQFRDPVSSAQRKRSTTNPLHP